MPQRRAAWDIRHWCALVAALAELVRDPCSCGAIAARSSDQVQCDYLKDGNKTCVIETSKQFYADTHLSWYGSVLFTGGAIYGTSAGSLLSLQVEGDLSLEQLAQVTASGDLTLQAGSVSLRNQSQIVGGSVQLTSGGLISMSEHALLKGSNGDVSVEGAGVYLNFAFLFASGHLLVGASFDGLLTDTSCNQGVDMVHNASAVGASVSITCRQSYVSLAEGSTLQAVDPDSSVQITAHDVNLGGGSIVESHGLTIHAAADANVSGALPGLKLNSGTTLLCVVNVSVVGHLILGQEDYSPLDLQELRAFAGSMHVLSWQKIQTNGPGCNNKPNAQDDLCIEILNPFESLQRTGGNMTMDPVLPSFNVSFDMILAVQESLRIDESTNLLASSMMLCSAGSAHLQHNVRVDVQGRGCGPGMGTGCGDSQKPEWNCGAGGGSHLGKGGWGAQYGSDFLSPCALPGFPYDTPTHHGLMPTQSASGGGCGVPPPCPKELYPELYGIQNPSAGGGLIWLSAKNIYFNTHVTLIADGSTGVAVGWQGGEQFVSGGGAGGQILLYASWVQAESVVLSAQGAPTQCTESQISGAGGGGFIGLLWGGRRAMPSSVAAAFEVHTSGGRISDDCFARIPRQRSNTLLGLPGRALSFKPCSVGFYGLFCSPCPVGMYNADNFSTCTLCSNKPNTTNAEYTGEPGWPNASCAYKCSSGVPNVESNPKCMNALRYALWLYGGRTGLLLILGVLLLVTAFLICRRMGVGQGILLRGPAQRGSMILSFNQGLPSEGNCCQRTCRKLRKCLTCGLSSRCGANSDNSATQFTREKLPFHIGRLFLHGHNTAASPWAVDDSVPGFVEQLVLPQQWDIFALQASRCAQIPWTEAHCERVLKFLYPPLMPMYSVWRRRQRARAVRLCTHNFSEGSACGLVVWRPIRARSQMGTGTGQLVMAFGCDSGATLGYLDFFDFSRSQFDWAPADLQREARLLVAHGHGSYAEPFEIDAADPVVHTLAAAGLGVFSVYSVISTFNRVARTLPAIDLEQAASGSLILRLRDQVEQCAYDCGLTDLVKVLVVPQLRLVTQDFSSVNARLRHDSQPSFSDLIRSAPSTPLRQDWVSPSGGSLSWVAGQRGSEERPGSPGFPALESSALSSASVTQQKPAPRGLDARLCLAFANCTNVFESRARDVGAAICQSGAAPHPLPSALTSPMPPECWIEHLARLQERRHAPTSCLRGRLALCISSCRVCVCRGFVPGMSLGYATSSTVLLLLVSLFFFDLMVFLLIGSILIRLSGAILALWVLAPPLTQLLATITGPLFAVCEEPRLGRFFASLTVLGIANSAVLLAAVLWFFRGSEFFDVLELMIACAVKVALFVCVNVHISNLETGRDLSFMESSQAQEDFLNRQQADANPPEVLGPSSDSLLDAASMFEGQEGHEGHEGPASLFEGRIEGGGGDPATPPSLRSAKLPGSSSGPSSKAFTPSPF